MVIVVWSQDSHWNRRLNEPSFRSAAKELGDKVAAEAENSTVVQELEAAVARACREAVST